MGRLEEQMVAARESRASSKSETAALHNALSVVLTSSPPFFFVHIQKMKNSTPTLPPEGRASPCAVRMQRAKSWVCPAGWESHVPFQRAAHL